MTSTATATPPAATRAAPRDRILVVTEDPSFIEQVRAAFDGEGTDVIGCLGPTASTCFLLVEGLCPLAEGCRVVVVESPPGGSFKNHLTDIVAGDYAERLQRAHPDAFVLLIPASSDPSGPTGEIAVVGDRRESIHLLTWVSRASAISKSARERRQK